MKRPSPYLIYYGPVAGWMAFIFAMSSGIGEGDNTRGLIASIIGMLSPSTLKTLTFEDLALINYAVRKAGHVTEFCILMLLAVRALHFGRPCLDRRSLLIALLFCALYAAGDEMHQAFVAGRSASIVDVGIDSVGALLGLTLTLFFSQARQRKCRLGNCRATMAPTSEVEAAKP